MRNNSILKELNKTVHSNTINNLTRPKALQMQYLNKNPTQQIKIILSIIDTITQTFLDGIASPGINSNCKIYNIYK